MNYLFQKGIIYENDEFSLILKNESTLSLKNRGCYLIKFNENSSLSIASFEVAQK